MRRGRGREAGSGKGVAFDATRTRLLGENTHKAASGLHLGAKSSLGGVGGTLICNQELCNWNLRKRRTMVGNYRRHGTLSTSNRKNPAICINASLQARVGSQENGTFALFNFPQLKSKSTFKYFQKFTICFNSFHTQSTLFTKCNEK